MAQMDAIRVGVVKKMRQWLLWEKARKWVDFCCSLYSLNQEWRIIMRDNVSWNTKEESVAAVYAATTWRDKLLDRHSKKLLCQRSDAFRMKAARHRFTDWCHGTPAGEIRQKRVPSGVRFFCFAAFSVSFRPWPKTARKCLEGFYRLLIEHYYTDK